MFRKNKKKTAVLLAFVSAFGLVSCGLMGGEKDEDIVILEQEEERAEYTLDVARIEDVVLSQKVKCIYRQIDDEELSFQVTGKQVSQVFVEEGDSVKKGDLVAQLITDNIDFEISTLEYQIARNELLLAQVLERKALDREIVNHDYFAHEQTDELKEKWDEALLKVENSYKHEIEDYQDQLEVARLRLAALQEDKAKGSLYAGMTGTVSYVKKHLEGSTSREGEVVMKIIDDSVCLFNSDQIEMKDCFSEGEIVLLKITSAKVMGTFEVLPYKMNTWKDKMYFAFVEKPADVEMEVGISGEIVLAAEERKQVLALPYEAIHDADGKTFVYVLGENQMREVKWITVGLRGDDLVEVLDGLSEGDRVILK